MRKNRLHVYLDKSDYTAIMAAAKRSGMSASEWARQVLLGAARNEAARDGLAEVQDALDRTLRRHLRRLAGVMASSLREASIGRKLAEQVLYLIGWPDQSQTATRRLGPQGVLQRAEKYAQDQVRRATERGDWLDGGSAGSVQEEKPGPVDNNGEDRMVADDGGAA